MSEIKNMSLELLADLSDVLATGEVITRNNSTLDGEVRVKRGGLNEGLVHLIDHRIRERVLNKNVLMDVELAKMETAAILFLAIDNIDKAPAIREANGNYGIKHGGIKTVITKDRKGHYVLTGYDNKQTKEEATESINAVIAQYGNTPEFLGIYAQVGAVIASYGILPQAAEKSTPQEASQEDGLLYGHAYVEINGIAHECEHGVMREFKETVIENNALKAENQQLKNENAELRKKLEEKQNQQKVMKKSRPFGWER